MPYNTEKIRHAYISKRNSKRENQVITLMIADNKKWHYLAVKKFSSLFKGITSNNFGDFSYLNCLHSFSTKNNLKERENVCRNHDYSYLETSKEDRKILNYNYGEKLMKLPFIIYADMESLVGKIDTCHNNLENSSTTKINKHTTSGYSLFTFCSFEVTKNKHRYYRGKDCMKNFCRDLQKHAAKIIDCG